MGGNPGRWMDPFSIIIPWKQQAKQEQATQNMAAQNAASIKEVQQSQETAATQAAAAVDEKKRRVKASSDTVFTNPLGLGGMATTARKFLLGQ